MPRSSRFFSLPSARAGLIAGACGIAVWVAMLEAPARRSGAFWPPLSPESRAESGMVLSAHATGFADIQMTGPLPVHVLRVVDGDTVEARVQVWLGQAVQTRVRLRGIDAPELNGACGAERDRAMAARDRLAELIKGQSVWLTDIGRDKYFGRVVARLTDEQGRDLGEKLIQLGLARPYDGGRRQGWCRWGS